MTMTEAEDTATDEDERPTARQQFATQLSTRFRERNFAPSYVARRCRTTEPVVRSWISGSSIPTDDEWDFLLCVSREFIALVELWREARSTPPPPDPKSIQTIEPVEPVESTRTTERTPSDASRPAGSRSDGGLTDRGNHDDRTRAARAPRTTPESKFDDYACKITGGRIVKISLPSEFSRADASRVYAFLLTQVDDGRPDTEGKS